MKLRTANGRLLVLLEVVVHEAHDERRLADGSLAEQHQLDAAAGLWLRGCVRHCVYVMCARRGRGSGPAWVSRVEAGTVGRLRVYGLGYVVWVQVQVRRCCVGEGGCARLQVHAVAAAVAVGMLMATLRSGDEHRSRQDAPSPIGQPYEVLNTTYCYFRTFVVDKPSFPLRNKNLYAECMNWLYARLHHYNVRGLTNTIKYTPRGRPGDKRGFVTVEFETKKIADEVLSLYKNQHFYGSPVLAGKTKILMKHLGASWDPGHSRAHGQPRDHGTAEGTNFESVRDPLAVLFCRLSCTTIVT